MKGRHIVILLLLSFLLVGCPVGSKYPLGDSRKVQIDERLLGDWRSIKSKDIGEGILKVFQFNENEYYMEIKGDNDNDVSRVRSFITIIDNVSILNIQDIKNEFSSQKYVYIKYEMAKDNVLTFWTMDSNIIPKKELSKDELYSHVLSNINNDKFYEKVGSFIRDKH